LVKVRQLVNGQYAEDDRVKHTHRLTVDQWRILWQKQRD